MENKTNSQVYCGRIQPTHSRVPETPMVNFKKGGSDFRVHNYSSIGRQVVGFKHMNTSSTTAFTQSERFHMATEKRYPRYIGQDSSMRKQVLSNRKTASSISLGTSTRESDLKLYAIYTCKR